MVDAASDRSREPARYLLVTGTDTGVGKTVTTAALAVWHRSGGRQVSVVKPVQTGLVPNEPGDVDAVARLTGVEDIHELVRLPEPLAPESAALRSGAALPTVAELADRTAGIVPPSADLVLVEGAGGVRVRLDLLGGTVLDLGRALEWHGRVEVVVVVRAGLGTLNHTMLTVDAVRAAGLSVTGLVIGAWPTRPDLAATTNREDLPRLTGLPLLAALPADVGAWNPSEFQRSAPSWFDG